MSTMASQITSLTVVCSTVYSSADQRKHQSSASLAFVRGIHRWPVNSPYKGPVTRKMSPFDDVIMLTLVMLKPQYSITGSISWLLMPGSLCRQTNNRHGIDCIGETGFSHRRENAITPVISLSKNQCKCKYIYNFSEKNPALQGLNFGMDKELPSNL